MAGVAVGAEVCVSETREVGFAVSRGAFGEAGVVAQVAFGGAGQLIWGLVDAWSLGDGGVRDLRWLVGGGWCRCR